MCLPLNSQKVLNVVSSAAQAEEMEGGELLIWLPHKTSDMLQTVTAPRSCCHEIRAKRSKLLLVSICVFHVGCLLQNEINVLHKSYSM